MNKTVVASCLLMLHRNALKCLRLVPICLLLLCFYAGTAQTVLYVDDVKGNDANAGNSWAGAYKTVSLALHTARQNTAVDSILVAKGTYYPTADGNAKYSPIHLLRSNSDSD